MMRKLIIKKINELNKKHNKLVFEPLLTITSMYFTDQFLLKVYENLVRYDEEQNVKEYILNKKG